MAETTGATEPELTNQFSIDEEKEPDRIKLQVLKGLIEKNVNLSDFELGELLGFKSTSIEAVRREVAKTKMDSKGDKCYSWDYVLAFEVGDEELIMPSDKEKEAAKENGDNHEEWENGMKRSKRYGQIINAIWGKLEDAHLKVDGFRSHQWPSAGDAGGSDGGDAGGSDSDQVDRSDVTFFLVVGITENNLKLWADRRDTDLLIDPRGAVEIGRKRQFPLAMRTQLTEEEDPDKYSLPLQLWHHLYGEYNQAADPKVYKDYPRLKGKKAEEENLRTVFDEKTRLRIIYECLIADSNEGGAEIKIEDWILDKNHPLKAVFALHDPERQKHFEETWIKNWRIGDLMKAPLEEIRDYFGEPVAFYFGFLLFYLRWLVAPAIVGLLFFIWQMITMGTDDGYTIAVPGIPFMGLFMIFWCVAFVDFWARQEARYRQQWGMSKFETKAVARPQFEGEWTHDSVSGLWVEEYSFMKRGCKQSAVYSFVTVFMTLCVVLVVVVLMQRDKQPNNTYLKVGLGVANSVMIIIFDAIYKKVSQFGNDWENHRTDQDYQNNMIAKSFVFRFVNSFASLFFLAFVRPWQGGYGFYIRYNANVCTDEPSSYMSNLFSAYLDGMTNSNITSFDFETYGDDDQFSVCANSDDPDTDCRDDYTDLPNDPWDICFEGWYLNTDNETVATNYCGDWGAADDGESDGTWYCEPLCDETDMLNDRTQVILFELQIQLITLFLTAIVVQNTLEVGVPLLKEWIAKKKAGDDAPEMSEAEEQMDKDRYSNTIDDMSEMVVQFGYVTLFVMCFPLIPLLAIINNIFELKVDATNLVMSSQRPDPNGSDGLGTWNSVLNLFSIMSVATNALLITSRTQLLSQLISDDGAEVKLWFFSIFSIFLGIIVAVEKWVIPDVPDAVEKAVERQRLVESVLILGTAIDDADVDNPEDEEENAGHGPPTKDVDDWPFDPNPESLDVIEQTKKVPIKLTSADPEAAE